MKTKLTKRSLVSLCLLLVFAVATLGAGVSNVNAAGTYKAGTYEGEAKGHNATLKLKVTVSDTAITKIEITDHKETAGISDPAISRIPKGIIDNQSLAVDTVTGATVTSKAILSAVEAALVKAGGDVAALKTKKVEQAKAGEKVTKTADVVIVGGGGAGMSAAVAAAEKGSNVVLIEKTAILGGNTVLAGGGYNAVDPKLQDKLEITEVQLKDLQTLVKEEPKNELHKELLGKLAAQLEEYEKSGSKKLFDSVELHALQTYRAGDYLANLELVYELAKESPVTMNDLSERGLVWKDFTLTYVGALWPRSHEAKDYKSGLGFIETYLQAIESKKLPVEILMEVKGDSLIVENGKVTGVKATGADGTPYELKAKKGVILATGGFGANVDMRVKYNTQWERLDDAIKTSNSPAITGDGILMAEAVGANLIDMHCIQLLPTCDPKSGVASGYVGQATAIYVNKEGKRFVNELERRDVLVKAALEQTDSMFYLITNEKNTYLDENGVNKFGEPLTELLEQGRVIKGETIEELAGKLEIDPKVLQETINKFNKASETKNDPEFGRNAFADDILLTAGGPYYAIPRQPAVHHTMGGVQIDTAARVLNTEGEVIAGLYAAGEITGGIHGTNRVGANAVPDALTFGRIAGANVAGEK